MFENDAVFIEDGADASQERAAYVSDFKKLYTECICGDMREIDGRLRRECLGRIHDYVFDFLTFELDGIVRHTALHDLLPGKIAGVYPERWLYWRTLKSEPIIQDGADGQISEMFYKKPFQGLVIRIKGRGLVKAVNMPRGFLKSELCTKSFTLWRILRDPTLRHMIAGLDEELAGRFVETIGWTLIQNERLRALYPELFPKRGSIFGKNKNEFQVQCQRRGSDPTCQGKGMHSGITGRHVDHVILDDVIGLKNSGDEIQVAKACATVTELFKVKDPQSTVLSVGTPWAENDPHTLFLEKNSPLGADCSFMVCTLIDDDAAGACVQSGKKIGIKGPGNPMWPEQFSVSVIEQKRREITSEKEWFSQYFCQLRNSLARPFSSQWINTYAPSTGSGQAKECHAFYAGIRVQDASDADHVGMAAGCVLGQSLDRQQFYVLDLFKEKLSGAALGRAVCEFIVKWRDFARLQGAFFQPVTEELAYDSFLKNLLLPEFRTRGAKVAFNFTLLPMNPDVRCNLIQSMQLPYSQKRMHWPAALVRSSYEELESYDARQELEEEFVKFPSGRNDWILGAMGYAFSIAIPPNYTQEKKPSRARGPGIDNRTDRGGMAFSVGVANQQWELRV